jgi:sulfoquinovosyltransferase
MQVVNVLGFSMPYYKSPTLLLSLGLSIRVFWHLIMTRPDVIHVSSPGFLVFAGILYAKLLDLPLVVSYHTHVPGASFNCQPCRTWLVSNESILLCGHLL